MERTIIEGGYGYVFRPPLPVKDKNLNNKYMNKDYVMKIIVTENELKFSRKIRKLDIEGKHFLTIIDNGELEKEMKCKTAYAKRIGKNTSNVGYYMKYGGVTIDKYIVDNKCTAKHVWNMLKYCLQGLKLLQSKKIVHNDIYANNIVVGDDGLPRFIDFGLCYSYKSRIRCYDNYFFAIHNETLERPISEYVFNGELSKYEDDYDQSINYYYPGTNSVKYVKDMFSERGKDKLIFYEKYLYGNIQKIDIYCLGYLFFGFLEPLEDKGKVSVNFKDDGEQIYLCYLKLLLINMYHIDINLQYDVHQCLKYIENSEVLINNKIREEI